MQNVVDVEAGLPAKPWRAAGAQGHFEFQAWDIFAPGQRANEAPRLARQIVEGVFQGPESAQEVRGSLQPI